MTTANADNPPLESPPRHRQWRGWWRVAVLAAAVVALGAGLQRARQTQMDSALTEAVQAGPTERALGLLRRGAAPNARDPRVRRETDDRDFWQQMLATVRPSVRPTVLQRACASGDARLAAELIAHGADVNARGPGAKTALHVACLKDAAPCIALLVAHGADVNARDADGCTPLLHLLTARGGAAEVRLLLAHGADPRARDKSGADALAYARNAGRDPEGVGLLQRAANRR